MAYPPLILATTAAAMGWEVHLYFTFWGIDIITKGKSQKLKLAPVGNPSLPIPNMLGILPGMTAIATRMMKSRMRKKNMPSIPDMIKTAKELGVRFHACTPTMQLTGLTKEDLIPEVDDLIGAATFIDLSKEATATLFI
ncbi:DsrE/DsrF/DrsH-like family protein [Candidatus Bathyarchaeota archaeon]|nr:DsrE/DsrF/DrsH-like family protein [Candidatus Bathyarchaeota archaeon]